MCTCTCVYPHEGVDKTVYPQEGDVTGDSTTLSRSHHKGSKGDIPYWYITNMMS